jgi:hypothetical protein
MATAHSRDPDVNNARSGVSYHLMRGSHVAVVGALVAGLVACIPRASVRQPPWDGRCPKGTHPYLLESIPRCVPDKAHAPGSL